MAVFRIARPTHLDALLYLAPTNPHHLPLSIIQIIPPLWPLIQPVPDPPIKASFCLVFLVKIRCFHKCSYVPSIDAAYAWGRRGVGALSGVLVIEMKLAEGGAIADREGPGTFETLGESMCSPKVEAPRRVLVEGSAVGTW